MAGNAHRARGYHYAGLQRWTIKDGRGGGLWSSGVTTVSEGLDVDGSHYSKQHANGGHRSAIESGGEFRRREVRLSDIRFRKRLPRTDLGKQYSRCSNIEQQVTAAKPDSFWQTVGIH